jgi:small-conductance mechanosensitive channel
VTAYNLTSFSEFAIGELQTGDDTDLPDTAQPPMTAISEATLALLSLLIGLAVFLAGLAVVRRMPRLVGR